MIPHDFNADRQNLVSLLRAEGIADERVLNAMACVPRELFVPKEYLDQAYANRPLPIGNGQTISQPLIVAMMAEELCLQENNIVLEIGAGSGYAAAVFSKLVAKVYSLERRTELAELANRNLATASVSNVEVFAIDGEGGLPERAPYDAISITAATREVPHQLLAQLKVGGRLILPVGHSRHSQELVKVTRISMDSYEQESLGDVSFVPLIGTSGWPDIEQA